MSGTDDAKTDAPGKAPARWRYLRWLVRGACLAAAMAALYPGPGWPAWAAVLPAVSPFVAVASGLAARAWLAATGIGLVLCLVAVVRRRWFCRWLCPVGLGVDAAAWLGSRMGCKCPHTAPLGQWIALITLGGACLGYPLLLWLDPMALFAGAFGLAGPGWGSVPWWAAVGLPAVLLVSLVLPRIWCLRLCPAGAVQDMLWLATGAFRRGPAGKRPAVLSKGRVQLARRTVIFGLLGIVWGAAVKTARAAVPRRLRPPGAIDRARFTGVCIRCGNCMRACPTGIIRPQISGDGVSGLLAPTLSFERDYCLEDCTRCMDVCPSGALVRLAAAQKVRQPIGVPRVDMDVCLLGDDQECAVCRSRCPYGAITARFSKATYTLTPEIDLAKCPGCGACEAACPTKPVKAIVVEPR